MILVSISLLVFSWLVFLLAGAMFGAWLITLPFEARK